MSAEPAPPVIGWAPPGGSPPVGPPKKFSPWEGSTAAPQPNVPRCLVGCSPLGGWLGLPPTQAQGKVREGRKKVLFRVQSFSSSRSLTPAHWPTGNLTASRHWTLDDTGRREGILVGKQHLVP